MGSCRNCYTGGSSPPLVLIFKIIIYFGSVREWLKTGGLENRCLGNQSGPGVRIPPLPLKILKL